MADRWRCRVRRRNRAAGSGPRVAGAHRSGHDCPASERPEPGLPLQERGLSPGFASRRSSERPRPSPDRPDPVRLSPERPEPGLPLQERGLSPGFGVPSAHRAATTVPRTARTGLTTPGTRLVTGLANRGAHRSGHDCRPNGPNRAYHSRNAACHRASHRGAHRSGHDSIAPNGPNRAYHSRNAACHRASDAHRTAHPERPRPVDCPERPEPGLPLQERGLSPGLESRRSSERPRPSPERLPDFASRRSSERPRPSPDRPDPGLPPGRRSSEAPRRGGFPPPAGLPDEP